MKCQICAQYLSKSVFLSILVITRNPHPQLRRQPTSKEVPGASALQSHPGPQQWGNTQRAGTHTYRVKLSKAVFILRKCVASDSHVVVSVVSVCREQETDTHNCICRLHTRTIMHKHTVVFRVWWSGTVAVPVTLPVRWHAVFLKGTCTHRRLQTTATFADPTGKSYMHSKGCKHRMCTYRDWANY